MTFEINRPAKFIRLDLFPAQITDTETGTVLGEEFRIIITDDYVYIFQEGGHTPAIYFESALSEFEKVPTVGYTVTTEDKEFGVARAKNCGCGSRLRGFYPFLGVPYISQK